MLGLKQQYLESCYDFMVPSMLLITVHLGTALARGHVFARMLPVVHSICEQCSTATFLSLVKTSCYVLCPLDACDSNCILQLWTQDEDLTTPENVFQTYVSAVQ